MAKAILVVDDNPAIRKLLCRMFEDEQHYALCGEASTGEEAIRMAAELKPDLIVLDFSMPGMNGIETARQIKRLLPKVPIILFTQFSDFMPAFLRSEVDRVVAKNDVDSLMRHIRELASAW